MTSGATKKAASRPDFAALAIAMACALAMAATGLFLALLPWLPHVAASRDFVVYWSTGQQLVHHGNPYDPAAMNWLEHSTGFKAQGAYYMRSLPWGLWLAWPLGFFSPRAAALPWCLGLLAISILSVVQIGRTIPGINTEARWLGYCFPPALLCVINGQVSVLALAGLALFLRLHRAHPFRAGAALALCTLKPHLLVPFGAALVAWVVVKRAYRLLAGLAAAIAAACLLTEVVDPAAWAQYAHWALHSGIAGEYIPCLSVELRNLMDPRAGWLAFLPCLAGCAWALQYFWNRRDRWEWTNHGSVLVLVSLLVSPYCWIYDQGLALPALLCGLARNPSRRAIAVLALICLLIEGETLVRFWEASPLYLWIAPAWLAWYLWARPTTVAEKAGAAEAVPAL